MIISRKNQKRRRGVATVEMAFVSIILFMFLFGLFEYCRLLFVLNVTTNAARDTARFAAVHTGGGTMPGDATSYSQADLVSLMNTGQIGGITYGTGMCGMQGNISGMTVTVFTVDPVALAQTPAVVQPLAGSTWNSGSFGQNIAVNVIGTYQPVTPTLLYMPASVPFSVTVMVSTEAN
jgi:Flp pilus assembly protein TadG